MLGSDMTNSTKSKLSFVGIQVCSFLAGYEYMGEKGVIHTVCMTSSVIAVVLFFYLWDVFRDRALDEKLMKHAEKSKNG